MKTKFEFAFAPENRINFLENTINSLVVFIRLIKTEFAFAGLKFLANTKFALSQKKTKFTFFWSGFWPSEYQIAIFYKLVDATFFIDNDGDNLEKMLEAERNLDEERFSILD